MTYKPEEYLHLAMMVMMTLNTLMTMMMMVIMFRVFQNSIQYIYCDFDPAASGLRPGLEDEGQFLEG